MTEVPAGQQNPGRADTAAKLGSGGLPSPDPLVDSGSVGLRMFNLGTIPASVTPPRTWRRAAWFTVLASAGALVGLLVIGSLLVGPARSTRFDSMPNFPSGAPLATIPGPTTDLHAGLGVDRPTDSTPMTQDADRITDMGDTAPLADVPGSGSGSGDGSGGAVTRTRAPGRGASTSGPAPVVGTPPEVTTVSGDAEPVVDPAQLVTRTRSFFGAVTSNVGAAVDLTDDTIRDDAETVIHRKYGDVSSIQVKSISLDPTSGLTISVLRVVDKDGTESTRQSTLHFTLTGDPKIENPGG